MQVTVDDAYREACLALGEALVQQRFLAQEVERLSKQVRDLSPGPDLDGRNEP